MHFQDVIGSGICKSQRLGTHSSIKYSIHYCTRICSPLCHFPLCRSLTAKRRASNHCLPPSPRQLLVHHNTHNTVAFLLSACLLITYTTCYLLAFSEMHVYHLFNKTKILCIIYPCAGSSRFVSMHISTPPTLAN